MNYHEGQTSVGCQKVASQQEFTCSKSTKKKTLKKDAKYVKLKKSERRSRVYIVNFEHISLLF